MTRITSLAILAAGLAWATASRGDIEVAPLPREVRPDGTRVPPPEPTAKEDPREVVDRIIKNSKAVGDKLAMTDAGTDTRKTQDTILKDIDALLNPDDPPMSGQNQDDNKDKDKKNDHPKDSQDDMMPMPKSGDVPPKKDMGMPDMTPMAGMPMGDMPAGGMGGMGGTGGNDEQPKGRRPRQQEAQKDEGKDKKEPAGGGKEPKTDPGMGGAASKDAKAPAGKAPQPNTDSKNPQGQPTLPWEEEVVRDVWGHLPDKLRQQATQYYKQDVMPRYAELLKHYYASLAEKDEKK